MEKYAQLKSAALAHYKRSEMRAALALFTQAIHEGAQAPAKEIRALRFNAMKIAFELGLYEDAMGRGEQLLALLDQTSGMREEVVAEVEQAQVCVCMDSVYVCVTTWCAPNHHPPTHCHILVSSTHTHYIPRHRYTEH